MRILSLNAWGGRLVEPLLRFLREVDADVFCLQEVTRAVARSSEWLFYRDGEAELAQRADLFRELRETLPEHEAIFCPVAKGPLFDADEPIPSEWGLATFFRKTIPVVSQAMGFVHGDFSAGGWGAHPRARNAHALRLFDYRLNAAVTVAHMHGIWEPAGKGDTPARLAQADAFASLIRSVRRPGERLVACGDFNVLPESVTFAALAKIGLADLVTGRGHADTRTSFYPKPGRFADYFLVSPEVHVGRFEVVAEPEVSDHRALLAEIG